MLLNIIITSFFVFPVYQALIHNAFQQSSRNTLTTISVSRLSFLRCDGRTFSAESLAVKGSNSLSAVDYSSNVKSSSEKSVQQTSIQCGNEIACESRLRRLHCADNHGKQSSISNILGCGTADIRAVRRRRQGSSRGSITIASNRWTVATAKTPASKWSLCLSAQNTIFDEDVKELNQKGTEEMETVPVNMFHSVLCGNSRALPPTDPSVKEKEKEGAAEEKVPIVLLHGLLGSARNFQSWMKLVQQKESEIEREEYRVMQVGREGLQEGLYSLTLHLARLLSTYISHHAISVTDYVSLHVACKEQQESSPQHSAMTRTRMRDIICMDLRNHGRTGTPHPAHSTHS